MRITLDENVHLRMRELSKRKRMKTGKTLGATYKDAIEAFLKKARVPERVERIVRIQHQLEVPEGMHELMEACQALARSRKVTLAVILEEACENYLAEPDNHLGKAFEKTIRREFYK